jgi:2-methylcitrate dehydratase PrpD
LLLHGDTGTASDALSDLGTAYAIEEVYFKPFASARSVQPAVTGVLELARRHDLIPEMIETVEVETYPFATGLSSEVTEMTPVSARLSIPYAVAAALSTGQLGPGAFLPENLENQRTLALARRVKVRPTDRHNPTLTGTRESTVTIRLRDGRVLAAEKVRARWPVVSCQWSAYTT